MTGPGGVGKTRLALEVAARLADDLPDGVHFIPLAWVRDPAMVVTTIADALDVHEIGLDSIRDRLVGHIAGQRLLLVLDNFEHVLPAAELVGDLLASCPELRILATSRASLHLRDERVYPVPPLPLPDSRQDVALSELGKIPSLELFVQRTRAINPGFGLTAENALAVSAICVRLDGLPLAIELAAARSRALSPQALLARLDQRLRLLTGGPRDAPARQQTLSDTIQWSYDLLSQDQQALFRMLAVFVGGFSLDTAQAIAGNSDMLDDLEQLIDASLVTVEEDPQGNPRYGMLEMLREFGLERLAAQGGVEGTQARHADYFARLAEQADHALLVGSYQKHWLALLELEHANLQAAFDWAIRRADATTAFRLAVSLEEFWYALGHGDEGRRWLSIVLELRADVPVDVRGKACKSLGILAGACGDCDRAEALFAEAISLFRGAGDLSALAEVYGAAADVAMYQGQYVRAVDLYEQQLGAARAVGSQRLVVRALAGLSLMATVDGGYQEGEALAMEGLRIAREVDDQIDTAMLLGFLGAYALWQGDLETADRWGEQCLACARDLGDSGWIAVARQLLGYINLERENYPEAQRSLNESLQGFWRGREAMMCAECIEGLAGVAAGLGHHLRGARLLGVAAALRKRIGSPMPPPRQDRYDRTVVAVQRGLSDAAFQLAEADGRSWVLDKAISYALEPLEVGEPAPAAEALKILTPRELEVLRLVVDGRSNQEIAEALFISPHTAVRHVANIMNKLGVESRTAAAAWAIRQGIA